MAFPVIESTYGPVTATGSNTISLLAPTGLQKDDLILIFFSSVWTSTSSGIWQPQLYDCPAGFTNLADNDPHLARDAYSTYFYKFCDLTESWPITIDAITSHPDVGGISRPGPKIGYVLRISNVDKIKPFANAKGIANSFGSSYSTHTNNASGSPLERDLFCPRQGGNAYINDQTWWGTTLSPFEKYLSHSGSQTSLQSPLHVFGRWPISLNYGDNVRMGQNITKIGASLTWYYRLPSANAAAMRDIWPTEILGSADSDSLLIKSIATNTDSITSWERQISPYKNNILRINRQNNLYVRSTQLFNTNVDESTQQNSWHLNSTMWYANELKGYCGPNDGGSPFNGAKIAIWTETPNHAVFASPYPNPKNTTVFSYSPAISVETDGQQGHIITLRINSKFSKYSYGPKIETFTKTSGTSLSLAKPKGLVNGDLILLTFVSTDTNNDKPSAPSGFTEYSGYFRSRGTLCYYAKICDGTESWPISLSSTTSHNSIGSATRISGVSSLKNIFWHSEETHELNVQDIAWEFISPSSRSPNSGFSYLPLSSIFNGSLIIFDFFSDSGSWEGPGIIEHAGIAEVYTEAIAGQQGLISSKYFYKIGDKSYDSRAFGQSGSPLVTRFSSGPAYNTLYLYGRTASMKGESLLIIAPDNGGIINVTSTD